MPKRRPVKSPGRDGEVAIPREGILRTQATKTTELVRVGSTAGVRRRVEEHLLPFETRAWKSM